MNYKGLKVLHKPESKTVALVLVAIIGLILQGCSNSDEEFTADQITTSIVPQVTADDSPPEVDGNKQTDFATITTSASSSTSSNETDPSSNTPATSNPVQPEPLAIVAGQPKKVGNYNSELCIALNESDNTVVRQPCDSEGAAQLSFATVGTDGYGQLKLDDGCITLKSQPLDVGSVVSVEDCDTASESLWVPIDWRWGEDLVLLRNRTSGLCLAPQSNEAGSSLAQFACNPMDERLQLWDASFAAGLMAKDKSEVEPVAAVSHGSLDFNSFHRGTYKQDSWTHGDIAFYAPPGLVSDEIANQWIGWYSHMDALHRKVWNNPDFDSTYRAQDPNHGSKKVVALIADGDCSCGSKQQAEALGYNERMIEEPDNWRHHWILFYEMNRGGRTPDFYSRATWPNTHQGGLILPHLMAGLAYYEIGGPAGLERDVPGEIMRGLTAWRLKDTPLADEEIPADVQMGILFTILRDQGTDIFIETLHNMAQKQEATDPVMALCDFRDAVNSSTANQYDAQMTNDWRLPTNC